MICIRAHQPFSISVVKWNNHTHTLLVDRLLIEISRPSFWCPRKAYYFHIQKRGPWSSNEIDFLRVLYINSEKRRSFVVFVVVKLRNIQSFEQTLFTFYWSLFEVFCSGKKGDKAWGVKVRLPHWKDLFRDHGMHYCTLGSAYLWISQSIISRVLKSSQLFRCTRIL